MGDIRACPHCAAPLPCRRQYCYVKAKKKREQAERDTRRLYHRAFDAARDAGKTQEQAARIARAEVYGPKDPGAQ